MAPRRKVRARESQLAFESLSIEGGLISPEWLARVAQLDAGQQTEADYRIPKGLNLRDEIGRYWRIAQAQWADFARAWAAGTATKQVAEQFVNALLKDCLGFASLTARAPVTVDERTYPLAWAALEGRVPVVIVAPRPPAAGEARSALEDLSPELGDAGRRRSAFGLAQEYVNAEEDALWAIASDGMTLRLCRDNASLTRPAWIEADLDRIFREERYSDFAALWLLAHETRFGATGQLASACHLETWRSAGREEGTRAREFLRDGVEEALKALGKGFLANPANDALRKALHDGALSPNDFFQELLRLVYRLIFLLTAEELDLLHPVGVTDAVKARYALGYGLRRVRDRAVKRSAHDRFGDLWEGLKIVLRGVATGEPRLGLPALGGLFAVSQCPYLDGARLENRALLTAVFRLSWLRGDSGLARVNWRDMGPEELGSVYESLLELVPVIPPDHRGFSFATGDETKGNARKTTGSYYTPDSLVQVLLDSALDPVVQATVAAHPEDPVEALLKLSIVDPACGSGHFLLAAARRLAVHVARYQAKGTPSAEQYRHAVRQVVSRCLFGVDLNPMAVELCRVSLWMEAVEPGRPLSFLDSHIQQGNALLGATLELMAKGVPKEAFEPIEGDDRKAAAELKRRTREVSIGQRELGLGAPKSAEDEAAKVRTAVVALDATPEDEVGDVVAKAAMWGELQTSMEFTHQKVVADAWCAAFVWPKPPIEKGKSSPILDAAPVNGRWCQWRDSAEEPSPFTVKVVQELAGQYHFFHWHLAFPQVFARGGFDVVLGNPPWDRVKLQELEFFASRDDAIAGAVNAAARKKLIAKLPEENRPLWDEWVAASRAAEGQSHIIRQSGRYPLCGKGDVNTYALFAEQNRTMLGPSGRAGFIVPTGIATDSTTQDYFRDISDSRRLVAFYGFENEAKLFSGVDHRVNFCLLVVGQAQNAGGAEFAAFLRQPDLLRDPERTYRLTADDIALLNPNTHTCPVFKTRRDAEITLSIYMRCPVLVRVLPNGEENPWGARFMSMLHMSNDSALFQTRPQLDRDGWMLTGNTYSKGSRTLLPLYEAKMTYHFNHRYGDFANVGEDERGHILPNPSDLQLADPAFAVLPRYWVSDSDVERAAGEWTSRRWLLGWRDVTDPRSSVRTVVSTLIPWSAVSGKFPLLEVTHKDLWLIGANLSSLALDYVGRQKIGGVSLSMFIMRQLPLLQPGRYTEPATWDQRGSVRDWLKTRALELWFAAWDLEPFAKDVGYDGPPFRWDPERRFLLRAELDAAFFHLYGISRDDADYILDTFPIVRKNDEKAHGEYRTKRVILEVYDAMADAIRAGKPYQTRLDPPPADPRVAHPPKSHPSRTSLRQS